MVNLGNEVRKFNVKRITYKDYDTQITIYCYADIYANFLDI